MFDVDERAVSVTLGYVLTLGIVTLLLTGLLVASGEFVADQRENVVRDELRVVGQQVAHDLGAADRLVRASEGSPEVSVGRSLPPEVAGSSYAVTLAPGTPATLVLRSSNPVVTVEVLVRVETAVESSSATGGRVAVVYTGSGLEVQDG